MNDIDFINCLQKNAFEKLDISEYTPDIQGWMQSNLGDIFNLFLKDDSKIIIEVGTWKGLSTMTMANVIKQRYHTTNMPKIIAIDNWLGAPEFWTWGINDPSRGGSLNLNNGYPTIFYTFTKNVKKLGFDDIIAPLPISSIQGADICKYYKINADIIYVDAAHEYAAVKNDLNAYWDILKPGGVMYGDDYNSVHWPGVIKAVDEFANEKKIRVNTIGIIWFLHKTS